MIEILLVAGCVLAIRLFLGSEKFEELTDKIFNK